MDQSTLQTLFKMTLSLGAVLLVFAGVVLLLRRFSGLSSLVKRKAGKSKSKPIEILSFQNIGPGKNLYLVQCNGRKILIGATQQNISTLADLSEGLNDESNFQSSLEELDLEHQETRLKTSLSAQLREISRV